MFDELSRKLEGALKRLRGQGKISEANIGETLREVRRVLLDADVNYKVAKKFIDDVQAKALGQDVLTSITPGQLIVKLIHDELVALLGTSAAPVTFGATPPSVILVAGLQGSGKTTLSAKLALYFKKRGHHPLLVAADTYLLWIRSRRDASIRIGRQPSSNCGHWRARSMFLSTTRPGRTLSRSRGGE